MCRLLGAVTAEVVAHDELLQDAPRSLAALSPDHPHGWGLAVHDGRRDWNVYKSPACAKADERFSTLARAARGRMLVAHVRKRTVGPTSLENTHPFRRGRWIFAHNGTIHDVEQMERRTSGPRRREIEGDTDSERLFAYLLTAVDRAGGTFGVRRAAPGAVDAALHAAVAELTARPDFGAANFLLGDGEVLYAHRFGRTLHVLARRDAVLLASEQPGDEPWQELEEGALIRIDAGAQPRLRRLSAPAPARAPLAQTA
jgi:glutamine amidotransferase